MIEWAIGLLEDYRQMGNAGQLAFLVTILGPLAIVFGFTKARAKRKYEQTLKDGTATKAELDAAKLACATQERLYADLKRSMRHRKNSCPTVT